MRVTENQIHVSIPGDLPNRSLVARGDRIAGTVLICLLGLVAVSRIINDGWLARHDILAFYLPWYSLLGQQLREFNIPGWNPHLFSGTLFAADPQSGWTYLPTMLSFPFFNPLTAFKLTITIELFAAGLARMFWRGCSALHRSARLPQRWFMRLAQFPSISPTAAQFGSILKPSCQWPYWELSLGFALQRGGGGSLLAFSRE